MQRIIARPVLLSSLFILAWWSWAFYSNPGIAQNPMPPAAVTIQSPLLSPLDRHTLLTALQGDVATIRHLLAQWEADADLLTDAGRSPIKRFASSERLEAERLLRHLESQPEPPAPTVLPQTYLAADVLSALVPPASVVAIPEGYRESSNLPPREWLAAVPIDLASHTFEVLSSLRPSCAFIADYSHPGSVATLQGLGIPLVRIPYIRSMQDTRVCIETIAEHSNRRARGRLLSLFVRAAIDHLHNRVHAGSSPPRILCINRFADYSVAGEQTLTVNILEQLGIAELHHQCLRGASPDAWTHPIALETVAQLAPEVILVCCPDTTGRTRQRICSEPALGRCPAVVTGQVFEVDGNLQQTPSQYCVLAAFDLVDAVMQGGTTER